MELSSYTIFATWCRGKKLSPERIKKLFNRRVDKEDYVGSNKTEIINFLFELSSGGEDKNSHKRPLVK